MISLCLLTSLKEGTSNLENLGDYSVLWKGERDQMFTSVVEEWISDTTNFDPWEDHGTLFINKRRIFFFGWKVEMQGGVFLSIPIIEDDENRKRFIVTIWNFLHSTSKYWDELVEELLNFSPTEEIDPDNYSIMDFSFPKAALSFETFSELANYLWNLIAFNPLALLNASRTKITYNTLEIEFKSEQIPIKGLQQVLTSSIPSLSRIGFYLLDYLSSFAETERQQRYQDFIPMLNELENFENEMPNMNFIAKYSEQLSLLGSDLLQFLTKDAINDFMTIRTEFSQEELVNLVNLADLLYSQNEKEIALMVIGSVIEIVIEQRLFQIIKKIGNKISKWGSQQILSFIEILTVNFPNPENEIRDILAEIYLDFVDIAKTKDEKVSLANALATVGLVEDALTLRLHEFDNIDEEIHSLEIFEILLWATSLPTTNEKGLADMLTPYLVNALEVAPAGPILIEQIQNLFTKLTQEKRKRLILSFTVAITKNIEKVPILEQVQVLKIIKEHLIHFEEFQDLIAIINARLLDLIFEEEEDDPSLIDDLMEYLREHRNDADRVSPIIEKLLITAGKYGKYSLYLQLLDFAANFLNYTQHRHQILKAMARSALNAVNKEILIKERRFSIQIFYDITEMSVLNEDLDLLSEIMDQAIDVALEVRDIESLVTFYRMFFTIRQMAEIPWVDKLLHLQKTLIEMNMAPIAHELVQISLDLNTDLDIKERILKSQLAMEESHQGYLNPEQIVQIKQDLIEIYKSQNRVDDVLSELKTGHHELLQKGEGELAYHLAIEGIELIRDSGKENDQIKQFSEMVIDAFLRMVENYESNPTPANAATFIQYAPKIIESTKALPKERVLEMIELAIDELIIAYIRTKERKHIEYAQILIITFGKNIPENRPQFQRIFNKIINSKQKFEAKYSIHARFRDWMRFYQALDMVTEGYHELRSLLQTLKRKASKANQLSSELLTGLYAIGLFYYLMDCEFNENCKNDISSIALDYLQTIINLSDSNSAFLEKATNLYSMLEQNPSEVRTLVFHIDSLIKELGSPSIFVSH
ncbi:MAG: hypothetical protein D6732_07770 [Methanobacteriota archaeon]|nr:MAG: hypothetical protein D6732_07770 [Euryarchaeota archaeon]